MMTRMLRVNPDSDGPDHNQNSAAHETDDYIDIDDHPEPLITSTNVGVVGGGGGGGGGGGYVVSTNVNDDGKVEREQRSMALERTYVHDVYEQIAPHFKEGRHRPWPKVQQFLFEFEPGSLICDVGCGNGKYLGVNPDIYVIGSDQCSKIAEVAKERGHKILVCDNMALPFREESFDGALSIAVIHHFATTERRVQALRELARILRIGGRLMITVWALEQSHRKFESQDVLVPWHKPIQSSSEEQTSVEREIASTTTSDDDLLNYHAYTSGIDSEPYFVPNCQPRKKHKFRESWVRYRSRNNVDSCRSSSQSSSDLSSPNETCYSFVRRALQKLSSSRTWDDPHQRCRPPWFLQSMDSALNNSGCVGGGGGGGIGCGGSGGCEKQDSLDSNENADDIPIELHDVDNEMCDEEGDNDDDGVGKSDERSNNKKRFPLVPGSTSCLKTSAAKSHSVKCLRRSSSTESASSPTIRQKSKSLSDILSLFTVGFFHSRKTSQDSTSGSSTSSVTTKQSSSSSFGSKPTKQPRNDTLARSKSSHFTLAKVEEGNEAVVNAAAVQQTLVSGGVSSSSTTTAVTDCGRYQRWSVAGYPSGVKTTPDNGKTDPLAIIKRPRSLVLQGKEIRIPRTLSAEDHRNGNTILPDLDTCLSFYGLTTGARRDDGCPSSPPYMKVETTENCKTSTDEITKKPSQKNDPMVGEKTSIDTNPVDYLSKWIYGNNLFSCNRVTNKTFKTNIDSTSQPHLQSIDYRSAAAVGNASSFGQFDEENCKILHLSDYEKIHNSATTRHRTKSRYENHCFSRPNTKVRLKKDTIRDIFYNKVIDQIIAKEHLFPYHSMPNLRTDQFTNDEEEAIDHLSSLKVFKVATVKGDRTEKCGNCINRKGIVRRYSQPCELQVNMLNGQTTSETIVDKFSSYLSGKRRVLNGFKKRSFSVGILGGHTSSGGVCGFGGGSGGGGGVIDLRCDDSDGHTFDSEISFKNQCLERRSTCSHARVIKHSFSTGDSTLKALSVCSSSIAQSDSSHHLRCQNSAHKVITKEDSLQSDTSVDSDDSVASVIAVRQERSHSVDNESGSNGSGGDGCCISRVERLGSTCSKDSSNHSDTSVDSEESCVSVIAVSMRMDDDTVILQKGSSICQCADDTVTTVADHAVLDDSSTPTKSTEADCMARSDSNTSTKPAAADCTVCSDSSTLTKLMVVAVSESFDVAKSSIKDQEIIDLESCLESPEQEEVVEMSTETECTTMKTSVSWEKYLDACESLVLDNIFCVNAAHAAEMEEDEHMSIAHLLPTFYDMDGCNVMAEYYDSASPMMAETCWLDPTLSNSWKSSESVGDESDMEGLPQLDEDLEARTTSKQSTIEDMDDVDSLISSTLATCCSPSSSSMLSTTEMTPVGAAFPPDSPQGRLLEAAVDVANTLQSAVSVAVTNSLLNRERKSPSPKQAFHSFEPMRHEDIDSRITLWANDLIDYSDDPSNSTTDPWITTEINPIYQPTSPSKSTDELPMEDKLEKTVETIQKRTHKSKESSIKKRNSKDVAVETDPLPDLIVDLRKDTEESTKRKVFGPVDLITDRSRRVHEDVINGNVPGHRVPKQNDDALRHSGKDTERTVKSSRRYSESYVTTCAQLSQNKRFSYPQPKSSLSCHKFQNFNVSSECQRLILDEIVDTATATAATACETSFVSSDTTQINTSLSEVSQIQIVTPEQDVNGDVCTTFVSPTESGDATSKKISTDYNDLMQTSMASSIENHFGNLEFIVDGEVNEASGGGVDVTEEQPTPICPSKGIPRQEDDVPVTGDQFRNSPSLSTSDDSILSGSENGGSTTYHRYYHVFREGELDHLIEKYVENLHIISSYYDHSNWCIVAEKVQVWRI